MSPASAPEIFSNPRSASESPHGSPASLEAESPAGNLGTPAGSVLAAELHNRPSHSMHLTACMPTARVLQCLQILFSSQVATTHGESLIQLAMCMTYSVIEQVNGPVNGMTGQPGCKLESDAVTILPTGVVALQCEVRGHLQPSSLEDFLRDLEGSA